MKTILLVEDEPVDVLLMQRILKRLNISERLEVASDGQNAIDYLAAQGQFTDRTAHPLPYVVLLDLNLPRRSGFEVLAWMRATRQFKFLPVVIFTSSREDRDVNRAYSAGANAYLVKTPDTAELGRMVEVLHRFWVEYNHTDTSQSN